MARQRKRAGNQSPAGSSAAPAKKSVEPWRPIKPKNTLLWTHLGILLLVSLAVYFPTVRNGFVTDDNLQVLLNPQVKDSANWTQAFQGDVWSFSTGKKENSKYGSNYYRPLQILTYEAEYAAFGDHPWGWHLVNCLLNAAVVALVYLLAAELGGAGLALWSGLFFALQPMHTEAVSWVAALPELQCAVFLLLAMLFYHRARTRNSSPLLFTVSTAFFFVAVFSKETALLFPIILSGYELLYRKNTLREWKLWLPWTIPSFAAVLIYLAARISALHGFSPRIESVRPVLTPWQLLLAIPPVFANYIGKLLVPVGMNYFYDFPLHLQLDFVVIAASILLLLLVVAILLLRKDWPLLSFSLAWFLLTLAPALSLNSIGDNFFTERYLYIPSLGFSMLIGWLCNSVWTGTYSTAKKRVVAACAGVVLIFYVVQIERRIPVFRSNYSLFSYTVQQSPNSYRVQAGMATAYFDRGDEQQALKHGLRALELNPEYTLEHINVAGFLSDLGRYDEALPHLQTALQLEPDYLPAMVNLAKLYTLKKDWKRAAETYQHIAQLNPDQGPYFQALAGVAQGQELRMEHFSQLSDSATKNPRDLAVSIRLGDAASQAGDWKAAANAFRIAVALKPENPTLQYKLGISENQRGDFPAAVSAFQAAVKIKPDFTLARQGLAGALSRAGRFGDSNIELQRILREQPQWEHADQVHVNLAANYERLGDRTSAIMEYKQTLELNPNFDAARQRLQALSSGQ